MTTQFKILLWLNKSKVNSTGLAPIYLRISLGTRRAEIASGYFVKATEWNNKSHSVRSNCSLASEINEYLDSLKLKVSQINNQIISGNKPYTLSTIKNKLQGKDLPRTTLMEAIVYHNHQVESAVGKTHALGTYKGYKWFADKMKSFLIYQYKRADIPLAELNHIFISHFEQYLFNVLINQVNTVQKNITQLRKVINMCIDMDWLDKMPFKRLKPKPYTPQRDYLTKQELKILESLVIKNRRLETIRDLFVFQCYTGLGYIDLRKLSPVNVVKGVDGEDWIVIKRQKTKSRSPIPLLKKAKQIISKYHDPTRPTVFPVCSNQKFNAYLKELGEITNIKKRITTHTGRRTFATTITLSNGVPIETVSKMLGHSDLKTTAIYAKVIDAKVSEDMEKVKAILDRSTIEKQ